MVHAPRKENTFLQGRYRIVRPLGQGGMGTVYEAVDERLANIVALKETHFGDGRLRRQFENEARLLARLRHPALPKVSDHFEEDGGQFLVMEFIAGRDLWELLQERAAPFAPEEVVAWADQLLAALVYLHAQRPPVVHRDIKPQNLKLAGRNQIILLDFGLAKGEGDGAATGSPPRSVLGATLPYAPLEQILQVDQNLRETLAAEYPSQVEQVVRGGTGPRSDLYSLGATLIHLLTGKMPTPSAVRAMTVWGGNPDPLGELLEGEHLAPLVELLRRATALDGDERYGSAREMRAALREIIARQELTIIDVPQLPDEEGPDGEGRDSSAAGRAASPAAKLGWLRWLQKFFGRLFARENMAAWIGAAATILAAVLVIAGNLLTRSDDEQEYGGQVVNKDGHPVSGATVRIRDAQGNVQERKTDSVGRYYYMMKPSTRSAHFTVTADNYGPYERDMPPTQTGREAFILPPAAAPTPAVTPSPERPAATPTPSPTPPLARKKPRATPTPCSPRDILLGRC